MQTALGFEAVSHDYDGLLALDRVDLALRPNEMLCLVGPSGCGKSTLLRLAAGLERLQRGRITIADRLVADPGLDEPPERRGVGLVFQDYALFPHLTVQANVAFGLSRLAVGARRARVAAILAQVGMNDYAAAYPHMLSGGQQQRVALARALAPAPQLMLLDEPFSGLDARLREQIRDDTLRVVKASGAATILVTHEPEEAMFMADRIAVMRAGRIEQIGSPTALYDQPTNGFVAAFFSQVNRLSGRVAKGRVATPFGDLPAAPGQGDGLAVEVVIRPEALKFDAAEGATGAGVRIELARLLGRSSLVEFRLEEGPLGERLFAARAPGRFLPPAGARLRVRLDPAQAFVFPAEHPTS